MVCIGFWLPQSTKDPSYSLVALDATNAVLGTMSLKTSEKPELISADHRDLSIETVDDMENGQSLGNDTRSRDDAHSTFEPTKYQPRAETMMNVPLTQEEIDQLLQSKSVSDRSKPCVIRAFWNDC